MRLLLFGMLSQKISWVSGILLRLLPRSSHLRHRNCLINLGPGIYSLLFLYYNFVFKKKRKKKRVKKKSATFWHLEAVGKSLVLMAAWDTALTLEQITLDFGPKKFRASMTWWCVKAQGESSWVGGLLVRGDFPCLVLCLVQCKGKLVVYGGESAGFVGFPCAAAKTSVEVCGWMCGWILAVSCVLSPLHHQVKWSCR